MIVNSSFPAHSCSSGNSLDENKNIVIRDSSGVIKSPGYPSGYTVYLIEQCYWKIFAPKGKVIRVEFLSFRLGWGACIDVVHTINKKYSVETSHCSQKPSFVVYSMTNELGIRVRELYSTGPGFIANYTTVTAGNNQWFAFRYFTWQGWVMSGWEGGGGWVPLPFLVYCRKKAIDQPSSEQILYLVWGEGRGLACTLAQFLRPPLLNFLHNTSSRGIRPSLTYEPADV